MSGVYLGMLEQNDPLYGFMVKDIMPKAESEVRDPVFHVSRLPGSNMVFKYHEERTRKQFIGKFYRHFEPAKEQRLRGEFDNLNRARALGLTRLPNYVVRPFGRDREMGLGLMEEYVEGNDLDHYIRRAVHEGRGKRLKRRLTELASFLAVLHKKTATGRFLDISPSVKYFEKVLEKLRRKGVIDEAQRGDFRSLEERWRERDFMRRDEEVAIHGDATPTNFLFPKEKGVIAIDLERMRDGDRMFDVGMVCGELKHAFIWRTGNKYMAEEYIGHFLDEYSGNFKNSGKIYRSLVRRNPFYMALTELRIARNGWLDRGHRAMLVKEAKECLRWGLRIK